MGLYYFDLETQGLHPESHGILTIQYQPLRLPTGEATGALRILPVWQSSEEEILRRFLPVFRGDSRWDFVPVGQNLPFDLDFLRVRSEHVLGLSLDPRFLFCHKPQLDFRPLLVLLNGGRFTGASLHQLSRKKMPGYLVPRWYAEHRYQPILRYVCEEAAAFVDLFQEALRVLPLALGPYLQRINAAKTGRVEQRRPRPGGAPR